MTQVACPVCEYLTFDTEDGFPGSYNICAVCFWEDDACQYEDFDYDAGANSVSVNQAKKNFKECGASEPHLKESCRPPEPGEIPPDENN